MALSGPTSVALAQGSSADEAIEEVIVSGLRGKPRSAIDSAVPIDTFDAAAIEQVSHVDTVDILQTLVPSFNVGRQPISDGSTFIRPIELRGLPSHHTLVLVNGKRRHRASLVSIGGSGTQGPDVATIPSIAIQSLEVLRDGASSQYGSDAIAGVINFNLRDNSEGFSLVADTGQFYEGDGSQYMVGANWGLPLGENGFFSVSGELTQADFTQRDEQYCETWFCVDPTVGPDRFASNNEVRQGYITGTPTPTVSAYEQGLQSAFPAGVSSASVEGNVVQPWGQPNNEAARVFYNAGIEMDSGIELYSFGNYSASKGDGGFFYRYPQNGTIELLRNQDGSLYSPLEKFPGGFTPRFEGEVTDIGFAAGVRGERDNGFTWDVSGRFGSSEIDYRLFNTINPSQGQASPTDFRPGSLTNEEVQFQVDLSNEFDIGTDSPLVFAYGLSYLDESYDVGESNDPDSYEAGPHALSDPYGFCDNGVLTAAGTAANGNIPADQAIDCANPDDPAFTVVGVGSNGFPGYSPAFSDDFTRDSFGVYADLSTDVTENFFLQGAIRYEDYSDFGDELVGKVAGRLLLNENFAVRGSIGTGFRAPTVGQQGTTNVSTRLPNGFPVATGLFPASGAVAQALGADQLQAETSTSYTFGITAEIEGLNLTVDFYQIDIDDRFNAISTRDVSTDPGAGEAYDNFLALQAAGVAGAESIGGVFYFANAFDSETRGVDIVASYPIEWENGQNTNVQFAFNWNESEIASDASAFLNEEEQFDFENADPNTRWNLTATHNVGEVTLLGRVRYFGESENSDRNTSFLPALFMQRFDQTTFVDLEAAWQVNDNWRVTVGARNLFDSFPDELDREASDNDQCCGRVYSSGSVVPWQGGYYYGRVNVSF